MQHKIFRDSTDVKCGLSGAHGTGKSTLVQHVLENLGDNVKVTLEAPRVLAQEIQSPDFFQRNNNTLARQLVIFAKHLQQEICVENTPLLLTDRTLVDHWAYTEYLHKENQEYQALRGIISSMIREYCNTLKHIFYLPIEFSVEADGTREDDVNFQLNIDELMRKLYKELDIPIIILSGNINERYKTFKKYIGEIQ